MPNVQFEPLETRNTSTHAGYSNALKACNIFVNLAMACGQTFKNPMTLTVEDFDTVEKIEVFKKFIGCYSSFLVKHLHDGKHHYACGTQLQYLSGVMAKLCQMFPNVTAISIGPPPHPDAKWYIEAFRGLKMRGRVNAIKRGEAVAKATGGICPETVIQIGFELMKENTKNAIEDRAVIVTDLMAVGRASEAGHISNESSAYSSAEGAIFHAWPDMKTGDNTELPFFPQAVREDNEVGDEPDLDYLNDFFHAHACYYITAGASLAAAHDKDAPLDEAAPLFVFPNWANMAPGAISKKITTQILGRLKTTIVSLDSDDSSHGFRVGATNAMAMNRHVDIVAMIARGCWDWRGECMIFGYLTLLWYTSIAGKALAGYDDPRQKVSCVLCFIILVRVGSKT
jgi:hypothetical protein